MTDNNARDRLAKLVEAITPEHTDQILREIFREVVAGATVEEMSYAMGRIRTEQANPTYSAMGEHIWQLRYDRASKEAERYEAMFGTDGDGVVA